ncbi:MAG: ribonuclease T(2) [Sphingopyxis sp.]|nr:ribonuclease T(2) [Sphingopyxis sp.]
MLVGLALPVAAQAQALSCRIPDRIDVPRLERAPRGEAARPMPVTGYLLSLSWSPQYCASRRSPGERHDAVQCDGDAGRFGWVLHGLWPQGSGAQYPGWCRPARIVPQPVLREHLCMSPSVQLMQRQWAKHGICMSPTPAAYFRASAILYRALRWPDMAALGRGQPTAGSVRRAFSARNRGVTPAMLAVTTDRAGWLQEVRLCLNGRMRPVICLPQQRGLRDSNPVKIRQNVPR